MTISPYGLTGPKRNWSATELTVAAAGGLLAAVRDPRTGAPIKLAGSQALLSTGHVAALAACHGLERLRLEGSPVHVDVSGQETVVSTGPVLRVAHLLLNCAGDAGARRYGAPSGFFRCRDGIVRITAMEDHQWTALVTALGTPEWALSYTSGADRIEHAEDIERHLSETVAGWDKADCELRLQRFGVPATAMYGPAELVAADQFRARKAVRTVEAEGTAVQAIRSPYRVYHGGRADAAAPRRITGLRVAEVGHVLAVPLAGALLGAMGAEVTKLEEPDRLDMYRRRGPYIDGVPGVDRSAYFAMMNHSKRSMALDMGTDPEALDAALGEADVVMENLGPSRARRLGLDAVSVAGRRPGMLAVSSSGYGHTGPWSAFRAYAYNLQTSCGLAYLTRNAQGEPAEVDVAWADLISGVALATVVAAWAVGTAGDHGAAVDFSMAELVCQRFNEYLAAASAGLPGAQPEDGRNRQAPFAPHGVYPSRAADEWVALAVDSDGEWEALCSTLGNPAALGGTWWAGAEGRREDQDPLEAELRRLLAGWDAGQLTQRLQEAGVAASKVMRPADLVADEHLAVRGFFAEVQHPQWGRRQIIGLPWRFVGAGPIPLTASPELGDTAVSTQA